MKRTIDRETVQGFQDYLISNERGSATVEKYAHDATGFAVWLGSRELRKENVAAWKESLLEAGLKAETVNGKLAAIGSLLKFLNREDCKVKSLKIQRRAFRDAGRELTREEYTRLVDTAQKLGKTRLVLLMETICATGIRVSEVQYITVEAVDRGQAVIDLKGKNRTILLPGKLCRKLWKYAHKEKISTGEIFRTRTGRAMTRRQIWAEMKAICEEAGVSPTKVFPHNLRHLFATVFYRACRDIAKLADVLGHSSINTTRIYLMTGGNEHRRLLDGLRLVS